LNLANTRKNEKRRLYFKILESGGGYFLFEEIERKMYISLDTFLF